MLRRWIVYLLSLTGSMAFFIVYREWFAWLLLVTVTALPWFSLLVSLPSMLTTKCSLRCPEAVRMDVPARTALEVTGPLPAPAVSCRLRFRNDLSGMQRAGKPGQRIPTDHCGYVHIDYERVKVWDFMQLFFRRVRKGDSTGVYVEPKPVVCRLPKQLRVRSVKVWRPKPGGGFSENHDLREYRPGDELHGIHWKMTAKTGKLIYREPIEPAQQGYLLSLTLCGDSDALDKKLGQLLYVSQALLQRQLTHTVLCSTADGMAEFTVTDTASQRACLHTLLRSRKTVGETVIRNQNVLWQYHIGGDGNEER